MFGVNRTEIVVGVSQVVVDPAAVGVDPVSPAARAAFAAIFVGNDGSESEELKTWQFKSSRTFQRFAGLSSARVAFHVSLWKVTKRDTVYVPYNKSSL